jgi:hypothetical protein
MPNAEHFAQLLWLQAAPSLGRIGGTNRSSQNQSNPPGWPSYAAIHQLTIDQHCPGDFYSIVFA